MTTLVEVHPQFAYMTETPSGEAYTKGSSHLPAATAAAVIALVIAIAVFVLSVQRPPVAAATISGVYTHTIHTLNTAPDALGNSLPGEAYDQILVMTNVQLHNQSDKPIILRDLVTNVMLPDGPHSSMAITPRDYERVFKVYPELATLKTHTITRQTMLQPGETIDGMVISAFHVNEADWAARQDLNVTLQFQMHPDLVLHPGAAPEVR